MEAHESTRRVRGLGLPGLTGIEVPDLAVETWAEPLRRAWKRADEIVEQRHASWNLHRYEYQQFYSAWAGIAFRLRACAAHDAAFTSSFGRRGGALDDEELFAEDEALFGFFMNGLSALECLCYGLYALGALVCTPTGTPSVPPPPDFPLLVPAAPEKLRLIGLGRTLDAFTTRFPTSTITDCLKALKDDTTYSEWKDIRNVLAHHTASAGRTLDYSGSSAPFLWNGPPQAVKQWGGDIALSAESTTARYQWLREKVDSILGATAAFSADELPYSEGDLLRLVSEP
jgi:hypothetical protein